MISSDQVKGIILAVASTFFIGASFIIKKKGLKASSSTHLRAGAGGYGYLREPLWWAGFVSMAFGEICNFAAYAFAPAILVTPLGAISILVSTVMAHFMLNERLNVFGVVGCVLCVTGSITVVLHAPEEQAVSSVSELGQLAIQPAFAMYTMCVVGTVVYLIWVVAPRYGSSNLLVYIAICSVIGSLSVVSAKVLGIALKLTIEGENQLYAKETYLSLLIVVACVVTQLNYLNKALDLFNTAIVSPVYYVMFTTSVVVASMIMYQNNTKLEAIVNQVSGFITIVGGTFLLHTTKDIAVQWQDISHLATKGTSLSKFSKLSQGRQQQQVNDGLQHGDNVSVELQPMSGVSTLRE